MATIIRTHIATGEPVASGTVARRHAARFSSATVRNVMAGLEREGYLRQPHVSAGRVPTAKAYEFYAQHVAQRARLAPSDRSWIDSQLLREPSPELTLLPRASHVLAEVARSIGIVLTNPLPQESLQQARFLRVDESRVLVVLLTLSGVIRDKLVHVREPFTQEALDQTAAYLNKNFSGLTLQAIGDELNRRVLLERSRCERLAQNAVILWRACLEEMDAGASVYLEGTAHLVARAAESSREELSALLKTLEEKEKLVRLLNATLEQVDPGLHVMIGLENFSPPIRNFSLISASYGMRDRPLGWLAILGPARMDYPRIITTVNYVARIFNRILNEN